MSCSGSVPHNFHRNPTGGTQGEPGSYWNHNVHYQRVILNAVPVGCGAAIEVGCGDGMLARELAARCETVTGIDKDASMIALARETRDRGGAGNATFIGGDFLEHPFTEASFDFACANTAIHHMGSAAALTKMARVLAARRAIPASPALALLADLGQASGQAGVRSPRPRPCLK